MKYILIVIFLCTVFISSCESNKSITPTNEDSPLNENDEPDEIVCLLEENKDLQNLFAPSPPTESDQAEIEKSRHALALINHVNWVVSKIVHTESKVAMEEEYSGINADGLFLDFIEDQETIDCIKNVMNFVTDERLNINEREFLKQMFEEEKKSLIYNAIPNPTAIVSPDIKTLAINIGVSVATGYMRYKQSEQALKKEFKKENFRLDNDKIKHLNNLNITLLQKHYELVQKHKINDGNRTTVKMFEELNQRIEDRSKGYEKRTYDYLKAYERNFNYSPEYWYFRGKYAEMNDERDDELYAYNQFQKIHYPFLRNDRVAANVALNQCKILVEKEKKDFATIEDQLDIIKKNAETSDWDLYYYCGSIYLHVLSKPEEANECFLKAVNYLENSFTKELQSYYKEIDEKNKDSSRKFLTWDNNPLMLCRTQLMLSNLMCKTDNSSFKRFNNMLNDNMTMSPFEFFPYFTNSDLFDCEFLRVIQKSSFCTIDTSWYSTDVFEALVPLRFFYCGFNGVKIRFISGGEVKEQIDLTEKDLIYKEIGGKINKLAPKITRCISCKTSYEYDKIKKDKIDCIDIVFPNNYHSVAIRYSFDAGDPNKKLSTLYILPTHIVCDGKEIKLYPQYPEVTQGRTINVLKRFFK